MAYADNSDELKNEVIIDEIILIFFFNFRRKYFYFEISKI